MDYRSLGRFLGVRHWTTGQWVVNFTPCLGWIMCTNILTTHPLIINKIHNFHAEYDTPLTYCCPWQIPSKYNSFATQSLMRLLIPRQCPARSPSTASHYNSMSEIERLFGSPVAYIRGWIYTCPGHRLLSSDLGNVPGDVLPDDVKAEVSFPPDTWGHKPCAPV